MVVAFWLVSLACDPSDTASWQEPQDCEKERSQWARDECRATVAPSVFRQDLAAGERLVVQISDVLLRDYAWLTVTREVDMRGRRYCDRIETPEIRERCLTLVSRPHLLQQLQKGASPGPKGHPPPGPEAPKTPQ